MGLPGGERDDAQQPGGGAGEPPVGPAEQGDQGGGEHPADDRGVDLVAAYLRRLAGTILAAIDAEINRHDGDPAAALLAILDEIEADLRRPGFRGCAFNNASIEYNDPEHPARVQARGYREALRARLTGLAAQLDPDPPTVGPALGGQLAVLVDGAYTSAAHLGPDGPAADGLRLARHLIRERQ